MLLIDASQILRRDGTGIASYARSLVTTLHSEQRRVALLLDRRVSTTPGTPEIGISGQVFGNFAEQSATARMVELAISSRLGLSRRLDARRVAVESMRLASLDPGLPPNDAVFNVSNGLSFANAMFMLRRKLTEVTVPAKIALAHWTGPFPIRARGAPNVYTMHDAIPLRMPHLVVDRRGEAARRHNAIAAGADHIITVSEQAKQDIVETLGLPEDAVSVTYQPVPYLPPIDREVSERLVRDIYGAEPGGYAFFCGALEPKKNLYRLIEAFTLSGVRLKLLIAGPAGWLYDEVETLIDQLGARTLVPGRRQVRWLGYLPRMHLAALMQCARFFAFPSIYEGFGLPVAEAMQLGVPVLTSTAGGLAEVAGNAALLVNPLDVGDMSRQIRLIAADADLRHELSLRGPVQAARFSPNAHLHRLAAAYRRVGVSIPVDRESGFPSERQRRPEVPAFKAVG
ncbi:MAG: glycosyltransferase family 4 protein [Rhodospirillales bacterium]|jgi:glycosyltransferase involved in cell wall biosynthesis|nr:glycosyltransferase family 4 protein [Rhodospirillales bacterium]